MQQTIDKFENYKIKNLRSIYKDIRKNIKSLQELNEIEKKKNRIGKYFYKSVWKLFKDLFLDTITMFVVYVLADDFVELCNHFFHTHLTQSLFSSVVIAFIFSNLMKNYKRYLVAAFTNISILIKANIKIKRAIKLLNKTDLKIFETAEYYEKLHQDNSK